MFKNQPDNIVGVVVEPGDLLFRILRPVENVDQRTPYVKRVPMIFLRGFFIPGMIIKRPAIGGLHGLQVRHKLLV